MTTATNFMVINFADTGEVTALARDEFKLGFLGNQKITRASRIEFNEDKQKWEVWPRAKDGNFYGVAPGWGFDDYDIARAFEVRWLEQCALECVNAVDDLRGVMIGWETRPAFGLKNDYEALSKKD